MIATLYGNYRTRTLTEIWKDVTSFKADWEYSPFYKSDLLPDGGAETIYYLLYSKYANSHIANSDENQWKYRLMSRIWQYAPTWFKKLEIQDKLRALTETDILEGTRIINDRAYNPSTIPEGPNVVNGEIESINQQIRTKRKLSKIDAYSKLWSLLKPDVTSEFLDRFKDMFIVIAEPSGPLWYVSDDEEGI